ncbi:MAG: dihydropyrimidinase [Clostridia bacterium]|nr:dihydropyrimidinase [Clostridia bacterium]
MISLGIDTGGTYTDAVIFDFLSKKILSKAKALTTKDDLSKGIGNALDSLPSDLLLKVESVSLSTTLATNACVENKGGRSKLIFLGVDKRVVTTVGKSYGLPAADDMLFIECKTHFDGEIEEEPDWTVFRELIESKLKNLDSAAVVELYAMNNNAVIEKKAKAIIENYFDFPIICGHELFSDLNSIQRGASALLNSQLIPIIREFLNAVKISFKKRNITAPIVILRSDGTVMSEAFTAIRPVETLLCGPAASVLGGLALTGEKNSVIIDMGGTTTDVAIIKAGVPVKVTDGINIGNWRTYVKGLYIDTFGLGGDSAVRYKNNSLFLDTQRVLPLSVLASQYPEIINKLKNINKEKAKHTHLIHEFFVLIKDVSDKEKYSASEKNLCEELKKGPLIYSEAAAAAGKDLYTFNPSRLEKEGIILRSGLTPTDIMHIKGDFKLFDKNAALLGAKYIAFRLDIEVKELCNKVYELIKEKLYCNIVRILLEDNNRLYKTNFSENDPLYELIKNSRLKENDKNSFIAPSFHTSATLVGIGAPIHIFLPDVAERLGTKYIIPENAGVAIAIGALIGNISVNCNVEIKPELYAEGTVNYIIYGKNKNHKVEDLEKAIETAKQEVYEYLVTESKNRGAQGDLNITYEIFNNEAQAKDNDIYLGTIVSGTATQYTEFKLI